MPVFKVMLAFILAIAPINLGFGVEVQPRLLQVVNRTNYVLTGEYRDMTINLVNIESLVIRDLRLINCDIVITGCSRHVADGVYMRGGTWNVYPSKTLNAAVNNSTRWIGDNVSVPAQPALKWRRIWPGGPRPVSFTIPMDHVKASEKNYSENLWKLRDSAGTEFFARLTGWQPIPTQRLIRVTLDPGGRMASGPGFWSTYRPDEFLREIRYSNFDVSGHKQMSIYFGDGVTVTDSVFGPATLDYNLGFEHCANVTLRGVRARGNRTVQGNAVDVAFIFGIRGLLVRDCEIETLAVTSAGWEVSRVDVDMKLGILDRKDGWFRDVRAEGRVIVP